MKRGQAPFGLAHAHRLTPAAAATLISLALSGCGALQKAWKGGGGGGTLGYISVFDHPIADALRRGGPALQNYAALQQSKSCAEAQDTVVSLLTENMKATLESQVESIEKNGVMMEDRAVILNEQRASSAAAPMSKAAAEASGGPSDFTNTNNQIEGIEEGDFVKNNAGLIFVARQDTIEVVKSWPAAEMTKLATLKIEAAPQEMLLVGNDKLVVAARPQLKENRFRTDGELCYRRATSPKFAALQDDNYIPGCEEYAKDLTSLLVIDVSTPSSPKVIERKIIQGTFQSFRRIENSVRLVMSQNFSYPDGIDLDLNYVNDVSSANIRRKARETLDRNVTKLRQLSLEAILDAPKGRTDPAKLAAGGSTLQKITFEPTCGNIYTPQILSTNLSVTKIVTYDLTRNTVSQSIIPGFAGTIYASKKSLYLASSTWAGGFNWSQQVPAGRPFDHTFVHRFDVSKPDHSSYLGSGFVEGTVLNQFSLDEHEEVLRIATTINRSTANARQRGPDSVSRVTTLGLKDNALKVLGQTPDLAPGERIYSARFAGNRGFVVTFRQVDPLFAIDLRDPGNPKVVGELKLPGFSNYMQFIGENTILTIGRDADINTGRAQETKISVFDVSDMKNLREVGAKVLDGGTWQSSEALANHKAFTYFAKTGHLAIPLQSTSYQNGQYKYQNELRIFHINPTAGVTDAGTMDTNVFQNNSVRRSIFADDVVYAISESGIKAALVAQPESELKSITFGTK